MYIFFQKYIYFAICNEMCGLFGCVCNGFLPLKERRTKTQCSSCSTCLIKDDNVNTTQIQNNKRGKTRNRAIWCREHKDRKQTHLVQRPQRQETDTSGAANKKTRNKHQQSTTRIWLTKYGSQSETTIDSCL